MANLKEIVEGSIDNIAQETIDENTYYSIDMADGGITNAQMASAIAHPEFFNSGDVYQCIDSGTYTEKHFYKFNGTTWVDVTLEWGYPMLTGTNDPTTATEGLVNQLYRNTTSNALFVCTAVTSGTPNTYTWIAVGGSGGKYVHYLSVSSSFPYQQWGAILINDVSTPYKTGTALGTALRNAGFTSLNNTLNITTVMYYALGAPSYIKMWNRVYAGTGTDNTFHFYGSRISINNNTIQINNSAVNVSQITNVQPDSGSQNFYNSGVNDIVVQL